MAGSRSHQADLDDYRITAPAEIQAMLQRLVDERGLVSLSGPQGQAYTTLMWQADVQHRHIHFSAEDGDDRLDALIEGGEITAVAYLDQIKVQFDLAGLLQVTGPQGSSLRANWPGLIYRFQRREAFRVQPLPAQVPTAHLYHPHMPDVELHLRVLDVSLGGVALFLPDKVPMIPAGVKLQGCRLELDDQTALTVTMVVHHVTAIHPQTHGVRLGCELMDVDRTDRSLGNYINQTQKRRAALALERR
jgi:c-di-GMP-binding flagellar brake protein YcgR